MILKHLYRKRLRFVARVLLIIFSFQILSPLQSWALTSGPSQPEMQSFEPVGTTDLVNLFSGDFNYNIPLLDVGGYPINIAYHAGVNMEQEASWVGLGWNINPGNINHIVRGIPDDFNGDQMKKTINISDEHRYRMQTSVGLEILGKNIKGKRSGESGKGVSLSLGLGASFSNYSGFSFDFNPGLGGHLPVGKWISPGINLSARASTSNGADFNPSFNIRQRDGGTKIDGAATALYTGRFGQQFNTREGLKQTSFGVSAQVGSQDASSEGAEAGQRYMKGNSISSLNASYTPIGLTNYVPSITTQTSMLTTFLQLKVGGEINGFMPNGTQQIGHDIIHVKSNGTRSAYGYLNLGNAQKSGGNGIMDFTRDRGGMFNQEMKYLPPSSTTYDLFSVSGQGTGGSFRPFRNDIGVVHDPIMRNDGMNFSAQVEVGLPPNLFEVGVDGTLAFTASESGPWKKYHSGKGFKKRSVGSKYEPYYFKQAGELTLANENLKKDINGTANMDDYLPLTATEIQNVNASNIIGNRNTRNVRSNLLYFFTAQEAQNAGVSLQPKIESYTQQGYPSNVAKFNRVGGYRKGHHISEVVQLLPDGRRYVYGIPAMNVNQEEYVTSVNVPNSIYSSNLTGNFDIANTDLFIDQDEGQPVGALGYGKKTFMKSETPAYAHSYLLSTILSSDYSDLTGDGISDDDLGNYTKFNYTLKDSKYGWKTPFADDSWKFNSGVRSDCQDDQATMVQGQKEIWMLHSIETKNYVAEFHTSPRVDGAGSAIASSNGNNHSYKLDRIVLYNKQDRIDNGANAYPIKEVKFTYDYSLCPGIQNRNGGASSTGKLTLKAISIKNGKSDIGLLSPYRFEYNASFNKGYNDLEKDVWGNYKPQGTAISNYEFPYVNQNDPNNDDHAASWNLSKIKLPSGGDISVTYEADDYAFVQDRQAMEFVNVVGMGTSDKLKKNFSLYTDVDYPYLYMYFKRKKTEELYSNNIVKSYLGSLDKPIAYNFEVKINSSQAASCNIPLQDNIKGYADVEAAGICDDDDYAWIKLKPKELTRSGKLVAMTNDGEDKLRLNPITVSAINYARYHNNKAINPASDMPFPNLANVIASMASAVSEYQNFIRTPMIKYLNAGLAKYFNEGRSFVRLQSQGFKEGGGHRVKRIEFSDGWSTMVNGKSSAIYGSEYDYTTDLETESLTTQPVQQTNTKKISSGVASYEPLIGGEENPFKEELKTDRIGQEQKFPRTLPMELIVEGPYWRIVISITINWL